jgi:hypothetical protein
MPDPMPPTVYGPVTPISPSVRLTGVVANAQVTVHANATQIGQIAAPKAGEIYVPISTKPSVGETITAVQKVGADVSGQSLTTIVVSPVPDPLPTPVVLSAPNTCMVDVLADGLVPGASVASSIGTTSFGTAIPSASPAWLGINSTQAIAANSVFSIVQKAVVGSTTLTSPTGSSPAIPLFSSSTDMLPPPQLGPLVECDTSRNFLQVIPGAQTRMTTVGPAGDWDNMSASYVGVDGPPLKQGGDRHASHAEVPAGRPGGEAHGRARAGSGFSYGDARPLPQDAPASGLKSGDRRRFASRSPSPASERTANDLGDRRALWPSRRHCPRT